MRNKAHSASRLDLQSIPVPPATATYQPVPHSEYVDIVTSRLPAFGLRVTGENFTLAKEGRQLFGVLDCKNGTDHGDWGPAIGLRSSYDKSLSAGLCAGTRVYVCSNLGFHGEVIAHRKHTTHIYNDLPKVIDGMLERLIVLQKQVSEEVDAMKATTLTDEKAHDFMVEAVRAKVIPIKSILKDFVDEWHTPSYTEFQPRTAWSLLNAYTSVRGKDRPASLQEDTMKFVQFMREQSLIPMVSAI